MMIMKHALRNITRAKGRNFLLGCIAFVIGLSTCLALSIREAANTQKKEGLATLQITANIELDREALMEALPQPEQEDRTTKEDTKESFQDNLAKVQAVSYTHLLCGAQRKE